MNQPLLRPREKLSGVEWFYHRMHAMLGAYCFTHFMYRFHIFFFGDDESMAFDGLSARKMTLIFLPHLALQLSGFAFHIPQRRYRDGFRIWPQYRAEALIFALRSLGLIALAWHKRNHHKEENDETILSVLAPLVFILSSSWSADLVGKYYESMDQRSNTLRDVNKARVDLIYLAASAQFHANVHILVMTRQYCVQFAALMIVQVTAFFMTLRRKGAVNVPLGIALYGIVLVVGMATIAKDSLDRGTFGIGFTLGNVTALLRFEASINKSCFGPPLRLSCRFFLIDFMGWPTKPWGKERPGLWHPCRALYCCLPQLRESNRRQRNDGNNDTTAFVSISSSCQAVSEESDQFYK